MNFLINCYIYIIICRVEHNTIFHSSFLAILFCIDYCGLFVNYFCKNCCGLIFCMSYCGLFVNFFLAWMCVSSFLHGCLWIVWVKLFARIVVDCFEFFLQGQLWIAGEIDDWSDARLQGWFWQRYDIKMLSYIKLSCNWINSYKRYCIILIIIFNWLGLM